MNVTPFLALNCPLDGAPLRRSGASWRCTAGHCFDVAAQGYTNLLPVQDKRSRDPGDSKEMVAARWRFLESGAYEQIAAAVSQAVIADLPPTPVFSCLDAGCGEGYYLRQLAGAAERSSEQQTLALLGLDISKWAVLAGAKRDMHDRRSNWVVGSNANLPVQTAALDRVLCMFGFPVYSEFARVLKAGGVLLQVDAGADHLRELREIIYPVLKAERAVAMFTPEGFTLESSETVRYPLNLVDQTQIADLLAMTPHLYRATAEGRAKAAALTTLNVTVDVRLSRLCRKSDG